jgi:predicted Zn-dependent protease
MEFFAAPGIQAAVMPPVPDRTLLSLRSLHALRDTLRRAILCLTVALPPLLVAAEAGAVDIELPSLGDASSAAVSPQVELKLGEAWLRMFRGQVKTVSDPLLQDYLEDVVFDLATHSELSEARLKVVLVDNETINAFAVPGGVVGLNNGLLLSAQHEDELASVIAHELAHLSQRHYARGVEEARRNTIPNMLILLSSLVLAATAGGQGSMAAIAAGQAAIQQQQLRFSRANEREADRMGMETLVSAGYDPEGMPRMFSRMLESMRYNTRRPPEFLLSHPVTESRVADSRNRARNYHDTQGRHDSTDFELLQARVRLGFEETPGYAIKRFRAEIDKDAGLNPANSYGLVLALTKASEFEAARKELAPLLQNYPSSIPVIVAAGELDLASGRVGDAVERLREQLAINPGNHPLTMLYADALLRAGDPQQAEAVLVTHVKTHSQDPEVWYQLAETHGLAGSILDVHRARAEFFILNGALDLAERQLGYALALAEGDFHATAGIQARITDIRTMREELKELKG